MDSEFLVFPPDTQCFLQNTLDFADCENDCGCPLTQDMVNFLNLTLSTKTYLQSYCLNPPSDDTCSFGFCDNPDISGILVRVSSYVTTLCLSIMLFYSPQDATSALWSQVLTMYSLLLTVGISIARHNLSRLYALLAVVLSGAPLSIYLVFYAIASFWYRRHRLALIFGDGQLVPRLLVIGAGILWLILLVISLVNTGHVKFSQPSCDEMYKNLGFIYVLPFVMFEVMLQSQPAIGVALIAPMIITAVTFCIAIFLQRKAIWREGERWSPRFGRIWSITGREYPFTHFMLVVLVPTLYWVTVIELACVTFSAGKGDIASYGQILACFVALPPIVAIIQLYPKFFKWFLNLVWVRAITGNRGIRDVEQKNMAADTSLDDITPGGNRLKAEVEIYNIASASSSGPGIPYHNKQ